MHYYRSILDQYLRHLRTTDDLTGQPTPVDIFQPRNIRGYLAACRGVGNKQNTIARKMSVLRSVVRFLSSDPAYGVSARLLQALPTPRESRPLPLFLTEAEARTFLDRIPRVSRNPERDLALALVFLTAGCRLSEVLRLTLDRLELDQGWIRVLGKGRKERRVPLPERTCRAIRAYLEVRARILREPTSVVFLNAWGFPLTKRALQSLFTRLFRRTGVWRPGLSIHKLRHSCLTLLLQAGVSLRTIQEIAGHATVATTQIYTHVVDQDKRQAAQRHPLA